MYPKLNENATKSLLTNSMDFIYVVKHKTTYKYLGDRRLVSSYNCAKQFRSRDAASNAILKLPKKLGITSDELEIVPVPKY